MKKMLVISLVLFAVYAPQAQSGHKVCVPVPTTIAYVDQVVTSYKCVTKEKTVPVTVNKLVPEEKSQEYTYYECVPETKKEKVKQIEYQTQQKKQSYTYYECQPVVKESKVKVVENTYKAKPMPYTYYECQPEVTKVKMTETFYTCVPSEVVQNVTTTHWVCSQVVDPCTHCCYSVKTPVCSVVPVKKTVYSYVPQTRDVFVNTTTYKKVQKTGTYMVNECVPVEKEMTVKTTEYVKVEKKGEYLVNECVKVEKDVMVDVTSYKQVKKEGVSKYTVYKCVPETIQQKVMYTEQVPVQTTIKVPVCVPCP